MTLTIKIGNATMVTTTISTMIASGTMTLKIGGVMTLLPQ